MNRTFLFNVSKRVIILLSVKLLCRRHDPAKLAELIGYVAQDDALYAGGI